MISIFLAFLLVLLDKKDYPEMLIIVGMFEMCFEALLLALQK